MKTTIFSIALVLGFAFATPSYDGGRRSDDDRDGHRHRDHCLSQQDVDSILSRWPRIFDGGQAGVDLITKTVTEDFTSYNEGFNFGNVTGPEIDVQGRAVLMTIQQHAVANKGNSDGKFSTVLEFHTGDKIAWRWQFIGQTNGDRCNTGTLAPAGQPVKYKGIDLLFIQRDTDLIQKVYTSADFINLYFDIQVDFRNTTVCPNTTPAAPICPFVPGA